MLHLLITNGEHIGPAKSVDNETTPMHAVCQGVKMFVECGADIHARNVDNVQTIDIACYSGFVDIVKFLRGCPTFINFSCLSSSTSIDYDCNTALHLTSETECMRSTPLHSTYRAGH